MVQHAPRFETVIRLSNAAKVTQHSERVMSSAGGGVNALENSTPGKAKQLHVVILVVVQQTAAGVRYEMLYLPTSDNVITSSSHAVCAHIFRLANIRPARKR